MHNAVQSIDNPVYRALTGTLTRKVENRVRNIVRYLLFVDTIGVDSVGVDSVGIENPLTGISDSGIPGVTILRRAEHATDQIIFFTDSIEYAWSETWKIVGKRPRLSTWQERYNIGNSYGSIVKIYTPRDGTLFAKNILNKNSEIEILASLETTDGRIIENILSHQKWMLRVVEKGVTTNIEWGWLSTRFGQEFFVRDTLTPDGKLQIITDHKDSESRRLSDGTEIDSLEWFTPWIWGIAIVSSSWSSRYERIWKKIYLTGSMIEDTYEISQLPIMTTDGTELQSVIQWTPWAPFMKVMVDHREVWAKSKLNPDGKIELLTETPMTINWERVECLYRKLDYKEQLPYHEVGLNKDYDTILWVSIDANGLCTPLLTPRGYRVNLIKETNIPWVWRLESGNDKYHNGIKDTCFAKIKWWKLSQFSILDSDLLKGILDNTIRYSSQGFEIEATTGQVSRRENI
jgi:hypothetical protein